MLVEGERRERDSAREWEAEWRERARAGESGTCLRKAARGIRFASFDGPDMLFKYPIELE